MFHSIRIEPVLSKWSKPVDLSLVMWKLLMYRGTGAHLATKLVFQINLISFHSIEGVGTDVLPLR